VSVAILIVPPQKTNPSAGTTNWWQR